MSNGIFIFFPNKHETPLVFKDSATVHVTCVMCYTGVELHCAQGILRYLLVRMSSAHESQSLVHKFKVLCTPLSGLVHMSSVSLASL